MEHRQPFVLAELDDLSAILSPLKCTSRIKYTTFNVSKNLIILGATSGGLYVFKREPCIFIQLVPNKEGAISQVALSGDERFIAFATVRGTVCALERIVPSTTKHIVSSFEHQNAQVTALQWNEDHDEVYIGDDTGKISVLTVSLFTPKNMFQTPSAPLMQLDSKVVQLDIHGEMLLVSTLTRCYICDTAREIFRQVGHKLRDGEYGACIFSPETLNNAVYTNKNKEYSHAKFSSVQNKCSLDYSHLKHLKLFCARPGSRVWQVSIEGVVINTLNFKPALSAPTTNIIFLNENVATQSNNNINSTIEQSFNFQKLFIILNKYLLTFKNHGLYIFDPGKAEVVLWNNELKDIIDVKCVCDTIYVWCANSKMVALNLILLEKFLIRLYFRKKYLTVGRLCLNNYDYLKHLPQDSKLHILADLDKKINDKHLVENIKPLLDIFSQKAHYKQIHAQKLKSGIYLVDNNTSRPSYLSGFNLAKNRSHSVSPDRVNTLGSHGSTSSLPELTDGCTDTMQTLKDFSSTVTDRFKDKWQLIEDKMKNFGQDSYDFTPFDVRTSDYDSNSISDIETETTDINRTSYPHLNTTEVEENCQESSDCIKLLTSVLKLNYIYEIKRKRQSEETIIDLDITSEYLWDNLNEVTPFPFRHYFTTDQCHYLSDVLSNSMKSSVLQNWLLNFIGSVDLDKTLRELFSCFDIESLKYDFKLSQILILFSEILHEDVFSNVLLNSNNDFCYFSLNALLDHTFEDSLINASYYQNLLFHIKNNDVEKCINYSNKINLDQFLYLLIKHERELSTSKYLEMCQLQCQTFFLSYLDSIEFDTLEISEFVARYIMKALEQLNFSSTSHVTCQCGLPLPGSQSSLPLFSEIGHLYLEKMWPKEPSRCIDLCRKIPYFWKNLLIIRRNENVETMLPLIIQLGDLEELEIRMDELNMHLLEICIIYLLDLKNGKCLNCHEAIHVEFLPWSQFGMLCVKVIGPSDSLILFKKYSLQINALDTRFYQSLIFSTIMEKHCKGLSKNVIDLMVGKTEREVSGIPVICQQLKDELDEHQLSRRTHKSKKIKEPNIHHWGLKLQLKEPCLLCMLPLNSSVLVSDGGLKVFQCKHAFHSVCLRKMDSFCPVCKVK